MIVERMEILEYHKKFEVEQKTFPGFETTIFVTFSLKQLE